jgi:lysophospholipase L1-like esterase
VRAALILMALVWCFVATAWVLRAFRVRARWVLPVLALVWLAIERFGTPHVALGLRMRTWLILQDPDHRPASTNFAQGWNEDSIRSARQPDEFRPQDLNIVFLGDSFTFGMLLPAHEAFPQKVEGLLAETFPDARVRVANFGWTTSSPLLSDRRLVDIGAGYHPDLVVTCVDMTDFYDDIKWMNMLERRGVYRLVATLPLASHAFELAFPDLFRRLHRRLGVDIPDGGQYFVAQRPLAETRPYARHLAGNLDSIARHARELGAEPVVFVLPRHFQYDARECPLNWEKDRYDLLGPYSLEPFRWFEELTPELDYPVYPLLDAFVGSGAFPTCFENDAHWNASGTSVAARAIAEQLEPHVRTLLGR